MESLKVLLAVPFMIFIYFATLWLFKFILGDTKRQNEKREKRS